MRENETPQQREERRRARTRALVAMRTPILIILGLLLMQVSPPLGMLLITIALRFLGS